MADDLGVDSLGLWPVATSYPPTPGLQRLADEGVLFSNCWSMPLCSPTRATLMTGRYPFDTGVTDVSTNSDLPTSEVTVAELLGLAGTTTCAIGKWHLAGEQEPCVDCCDPLNHGFGTYRGIPASRGHFITIPGSKCSPLEHYYCLLYTSPSPRDGLLSRMPSSA